MNSTDKLITEIMEECAKNGEPVSLEEATQMARMEINSKKNCKQYVTDKTQARKPAKKEVKLDPEKVKIISILIEKLNAAAIFENATIRNPQREIIFNIGEHNYSLILTLHRKQKN